MAFTTVLLLLLALTACGQKGGLYIPQDEPAAPPAQTDEQEE